MGAVWFTGILKTLSTCASLRIVLFTRVLNEGGRYVLIAPRLRAIRFTRTPKHWGCSCLQLPGLRAMRFTMVLKLTSSGARRGGSLRVVRFTRGLNQLHHWRRWTCGLRISSFKLFGETVIDAVLAARLFESCSVYKVSISSGGVRAFFVV